jgi:hypothetical protein
LKSTDLPINSTMTPHEKTSPNKPSDRRRRSRLNSSTAGWIMPDSDKSADPWEVRVQTVSRLGVGFESSEKIEDGEIVRIRIGRGPIELAKRMRIVRCNPAQDGSFRIGGEFL